MRVQITTKSLVIANALRDIFDWLGICSRYGTGRVFGMMEKPDSYVIELSFVNLLAK